MTRHQPSPKQVPPVLRVTEASPPSAHPSGYVAGAGQHLFSLFRTELLAFAANRGAVSQGAQSMEVSHG